MAGYVDGFRIAGVAAALLALVLTGIGVFQVVLVVGALGAYLWAVEEASRSAPHAAEPPAELEPAEPVS